MRIKRVRLEGFGVFVRPFEATFSPGLNAVVGPNESGKSTLLEGILGILFGIKDRAAEARIRSRDGAAAFCGELDMEVDSTVYTWQRDFDSHLVRLSRRQGGQNTVLYEGEANPRGRTDDLLAYLAALEPIIGLSDRDLAEQILFVRQGELETAVDEQIRHRLSGSRQGDYSDVISRLEDRFALLTRENPWGRRRARAREIEELEESIVRLEERTTRARGLLEQSAALADEMDAAGRAALELGAELSRREQMYNNYRQFFELNRERSDLEKRLRVLREEKEKVKSLAADCERVEKEIAARFAGYHQAGPELGDALRQLQIIQRDVGALEEELERRESDLAANLWPRLFRRALIVGGAALLVASAALFGAGVGIWSFLGGAVVGGLVFLLLYLRGKKKERERIHLEGQVVELEERLHRQQAELNRRQSELIPVIGRRRVQEVLEEYRQYGEQIDLLSRYEQIRDSHRRPAEAEADYDQVFNQLKLADSRARDLIASAPYLANADQDLPQMGDSLEKIKRERDDLAGRLTGARGQYDDLKLKRARQEGTPGEDVESLTDELTEACERLEVLRFRRDALQLAVETLRECVNHFQENHVDSLARKAGEIVARVTGGRWTRLTLDSAFHPVLHQSDGSAWTVESLSRGTLDQLYLALRLGMAQEILADRRPPLILDDALLQADHARQTALRRLLEEWASGTDQVILLGHDPEIARGAAQTLDLTRLGADHQAVRAPAA